MFMCYLDSSVHTQLPYDYYSLKFCRPKGGIKPYSENLGEFLRGDRIENSAYEVRLLRRTTFFFLVLMMCWIVIVDSFPC